MQRKPLTLLLFALVAGLLAAVGYWNISPSSFSEHASPAPVADSVDFYVVNAHSLQYQPDGKLHYELTSQRMEHMASSDKSMLDKPDLQLYRGTDYPWHVRSEKGEVAPSGSSVELIDQVRVERTDAKGRPILLTTSRLTVFPDRQYAETQQAVRIDAANGVTTGSGMKAYLKDGRMHLLSNVRGQHEVR